MKAKNSKSNSLRLRVTSALVAGLIVGLGGCKGNARLADHDVRSREVQSITAYGKVLDKNAPPIDVVYVFLKAVLDDYDAGKDHVKREAAFNTQLGVLATEQIKRVVAGPGPNDNRPETDKQGRKLRYPTEQQRLDAFYSAVRRFAPVVGHYREDFRADYETLTGQMFLGQFGGGSKAIVYVNLHHPDPEQRPGGNVIARFELVRERGFWRIWWVSFDNTFRDWNDKKKSQRPQKRATPENAPSSP